MYSNTLNNYTYMYMYIVHFMCSVLYIHVCTCTCTCNHEKMGVYMYMHVYKRKSITTYMYMCKSLKLNEDALRCRTLGTWLNYHLGMTACIHVHVHVYLVQTTLISCKQKQFTEKTYIVGLKYIFLL